MVCKTRYDSLFVIYTSPLGWRGNREGVGGRGPNVLVETNREKASVFESMPLI